MQALCFKMGCASSEWPKQSADSRLSQNPGQWLFQISPSDELCCYETLYVQLCCRSLRTAREMRKLKQLINAQVGMTLLYILGLVCKIGCELFDIVAIITSPT